MGAGLYINANGAVVHNAFAGKFHTYLFKHFNRGCVFNMRHGSYACKIQRMEPIL
jgi:hypothetical protein